MKHRTGSGVTAFVPAILLALVVALATSAAWASPSNKWRLVVDGSTKAGGEVELALTPKGGEAISLVVTIAAHTSENAAASVVRKALVAKFGKKDYKFEIDDGEDVLAKAKMGTGDFELVVVRNTADGLSFKLRRE